MVARPSNINLISVGEGFPLPLVWSFAPTNATGANPRRKRCPQGGAGGASQRRDEFFNRRVVGAAPLERSVRARAKRHRA